MDWTQALTVIGVFIGGFIYMMSKMDANKKDTDMKMDSNKKDTDQKIDTCRKELEQKIESKINTLDQKIDVLSSRSVRMEEQIKNTNQRIDDFKHEVNQRLSTIEGYLVPKKIFHFEEPHHDNDEPKEN